MTSLVRCPHCGHAADVEMPANACVIVHACAGCGVLLRPKAGDCCVFCSYGSTRCPPAHCARRDGS